MINQSSRDWQKSRVAADVTSPGRLFPSAIVGFSLNPGQTQPPWTTLTHVSFRSGRHAVPTVDSVGDWWNAHYVWIQPSSECNLPRMVILTDGTKAAMHACISLIGQNNQVPKPGPACGRRRREECTHIFPHRFRWQHLPGCNHIWKCLKKHTCNKLSSDWVAS